MDRLDAQILLALDDAPDITNLELARKLGIARNTLQARLQRLHANGTVLDYSRRISSAALGHALTAFVWVSLSQSSGPSATRALIGIPEVTEIHAVTGEADLLLRIAARDTGDLHRITRQLLTVSGVQRTSTMISMLEEMPLRVRPLLEQKVGEEQVT